MYNERRHCINYVCVRRMSACNSQTKEHLNKYYTYIIYYYIKRAFN